MPRVQALDPWWPLPFGAITIIQRVWKEDGVRGLLTGYPTTLAGATLSRGLSLCLDTLYDEFIHAWILASANDTAARNTWCFALIGPGRFPLFSLAYLAHQVSIRSALFCSVKASFGLIAASAVIGVITYPLTTGAHLCMSQVGRVPKAERIGGGSELWCNMHAYHTPDTWIQAIFSVAANFANFGAAAVFDMITRRGQRMAVRPPPRVQQQQQQQRRR